MSEASKPHKTPTLMHAEALSTLLAYDGYEGPFHESDARGAMEAACRMARHVESLVEQLEAARLTLDEISRSSYDVGVAKLARQALSNPAKERP